jgi:hypothetical protein
MYAAKNGCSIIHSVDSSVKAIDLCSKMHNSIMLQIMKDLHKIPLII